jgi:hypothetical protein
LLGQLHFALPSAHTQFPFTGLYVLGVQLPSYGTTIFTTGTLVGALSYMLVRVATSRARLMAAIEQVSDDLEAAGYSSVEA